MAGLFSRFNRTQLFKINPESFVEGTWLTAEDVYRIDMEETGELQFHKLLGAWRHEFSEGSRIPGAPSYKYTIGIEMQEVDDQGEIIVKNYYCNVPSHMNKDFDAILADRRLVQAINEGHCLVQAFEYSSRGGDWFSFRFKE